MKTTLPRTVALLLATAATLASGQEPTDENKETNRRHLKGQDEREANAKTALNQAMSELQNNPQGLFARLDSNENGQLSFEEFGRIVNIGAQGAAAVQGTKGIQGAGGATGTTGATSVAGQSGIVGQDPATYGQKPDATGQKPAAPPPGNNTPEDAAAAGQQPVAPAPGAAPAPPSSPAPAPVDNTGQNPKPAPGQPAPPTPPTAPITKDPSP